MPYQLLPYRISLALLTDLYELTIHEGHKRLKNPHIYPVGLSQDLHERKAAMIQEYRRSHG
jgi:nicotinate phosphoribosyltransferase family protein